MICINLNSWDVGGSWIGFGVLVYETYTSNSGVAGGNLADTKVFCPFIDFMWLRAMVFSL